MSSRRILLAVTVALALVAASGASAEPIDGYTATGAPSAVKPATQAAYTLSLTNASASESADRASVSIPSGFQLAATPVQATASCGARTWNVERGDGKINVKAPGSDASELCPGGTLTIGFTATSATAEGTYAWVTQLRDGNDDFVLSGARPTVRVDATAPETTITAGPADPTSQTSATFAFSANEGGSTFECSRDGAEFAVCASPRSYSGFAPGLHTFAVRATDTAGNTDASPASYSWLVETELPVVTLSETPANPTRERSAHFVFSASKPNATLECSLDAKDFVPCTTQTTQTYAGLGDGSHTFAVRATSAAGVGPTTRYSWTVDTTGPTATITQKPADPTNSRSATFVFAASEAGATFECKLDGAAFAKCTAPQTYTSVGDGRHTFVVRAIDALGNLGSESSYGWTIDTRSPGVAVTSGPAGLTNSTSASIFFVADEPSSFQCNLDGRGFEPCSSPASYAGLTDGGHAFGVRAIDAAGNVGAASRGWTIDATAPETTLASKPAARTTARSATFTFSAGEPATFECRLDGGSFLPCAPPTSYPRLANGVHRFSVRAVDAAGNVDPTPMEYSWAIRAVTRVVARSALFAPAAGARVTSPPLLRWRSVRGATYYNVQLYRGGRKVLTTWPTRTSLQLRSQWRFNGRTQRLAPGTYRWYVWPGRGRMSARRYGTLVGTSTFVVGRSASRR